MHKDSKKTRFHQPIKHRKQKNPTLTQVPEFFNLYPELSDANANELAAITGVHIKTARRWLTNQVGICAGHCRLITLAARGHLIPESWKPTLRFCGNTLVLNDGTTLTREQLHTYWVAIQQHEALKVTTRELEQTIADQNAYIAYLEQQAENASVRALDRAKMRPSVVDEHTKAHNPYFKEKHCIERTG